jgi:hypothetical protein
MSKVKLNLKKWEKHKLQMLKYMCQVNSIAEVVDFDSSALPVDVQRHFNSLMWAVDDMVASADKAIEVVEKNL